jgi:hypothetical protein
MRSNEPSRHFVPTKSDEEKSLKTLTPGACTTKLITAVIYGFSQYATVFVPGKPFQPSLMFAGKVGARDKL